MGNKKKPRIPALSTQDIERRKSICPAPEFDDALPINQHRDEIARLIEINQVVIVCGETGSGKTTQIPKICLQLGRGIRGRIAHTQPRRLAARSVAARIAAELKSEPGQAVGYKIRFNDRVSPGTYIKLMTDGILLAESQHDRLLREYDTIIIDEAHERSLNIDFLLGYLKALLPKRPDLKLIITSATIDPASFSRFFDDAPVIEVSGRSYPVETRYRPLLAADNDESDRDMIDGILHAVDELAREDAGDILVFVSGEREIREAADALRRHLATEREILPLYSRLSAHEQDRIFSSGGSRRIIIATNVAETSLTVPGIRHVIDTGLARISRYSYRSKVQQLPIEPVSQASANQRQGRCGRNAPGICIRLYSEDDFKQRPAFTDPEILRTNLASVILSLSNLRLGRLENFPFINSPDARVIRDGYRLLQELDALDDKLRITGLGQELSRLPIDPRLGRMLLAGRDYNCVNECLVICSALSIQDPRERPHEKRQQAKQQQRIFNAPSSDFITLLNVWNSFRKQGKQSSKNQLRRWCREHYLSWMRMREWGDILRQLTRQIRHRETEQVSAATDEAIHQALLSGLLSHIGHHEEGREYRGPRQRQFVLAADSVLVKKPPPWIMSASLVETHRLFARTNAAIAVEWIEKAAAHRCQKHYTEPHWEQSQGRVMANEQVTLFGLVLIAGRPVHYGPIDPELAREIFIREALVVGNYQTRSATINDNRKLISELEHLEHKRRRRDVVDEELIYQFYEKQIPAGIYQSKSFERWLKDTQKNNPEILRLQKYDLLQTQASHSLELFPDHLTISDTSYKLTYRFEPGHALDGVTVHLPVHQLNSLKQTDFDWLVPGMIREKLIYLIKSLPKAKRRHLVPIPETVTRFLEWSSAQDITRMPLLASFSHYLKKLKGLSISAHDWQPVQLPDHLKMGFRLIDSKGQPLAYSHDLADLQAEYSSAASQAFDAAPSWDIQREQVNDWDFGDLPLQVTQPLGNSDITGYPALCVDEQGMLSIDICDDPETAEQLHHAGLQALILKKLPEQARYLQKQMPDLQQQCLLFSGIGSCQELHNDLIAACLDHSFFNRSGLPRSGDEFTQILAEGKSQLVEAASRYCQLNLEALRLYHQCSLRLEKHSGSLAEYIAADMQQQIGNLIYPGYLQQTGLTHLRHLPRYLKGILVRLDKYENNPSRDSQLYQDLSPLTEKYLHEAENWVSLSATQHDKLEECHWMLEELRISLFAQELGTSRPASLKRLGKLFSDYEKL